MGESKRNWKNMDWIEVYQISNLKPYFVGFSQNDIV
jgi:hypothetical protein